MFQKMRNNSKGFTLIELMIVVAIIGILAAIAIPNFLQYQLKSKTSECKTNIGAIRTSQESFKAEYDFFADCAANPVAAAPGAKQPWTAGGNPAVGAGWLEIGFEPAGDVYYQYEVATAGGAVPAAPATRGGIAVANLGMEMTIEAYADLDADTTYGDWAFSTAFGTIATTGLSAAANTADNTLQDLAPGSF